MRLTAIRLVLATLASVVVVFTSMVAPAAAEVESAKAPAPKNIIIMISDGMGFNHMTATDYYQYGRSRAQFYEHFPVRLAMSTYAYNGKEAPFSLWMYDPILAWGAFVWVKSNPTDSASAATAMATGVKTYNAAINYGIDGKPLRTFFQNAEDLGKATGVVTSVQWSHATPAGFVAHNASRNNYAEIAAEMINSSATDVIFGAGHPLYTDSGEPLADPAKFQYKYVGGQATWDALQAGTAGGDANGDGVADPWTFVESRAGFLALMNGDTPDRVCGTAQVATTLQQSRGATASGGYADPNDAPPYTDPFNSGVPTLVDMTRAALNVLDNDPDGFVVMIEGGAVDWAGHANQIGRLIEEQIDFNRSVQAVQRWVAQNSNWGETLLIVTADHETGYLWGEGAGQDPANLWPAVKNNFAGNVPGYSWNSGDHTNSLVPFFAKGAQAMGFYNYVAGRDQVRGRYLDNTAIGTHITGLLQ